MTQKTVKRRSYTEEFRPIIQRKLLNFVYQLGYSPQIDLTAIDPYIYAHKPPAYK